MKQGHDRLAGRRAGFTLIELLVVVAVIAILIGILLPALGRARKSANTVKCASNMHQVAVSLVAYTADYNSRYPPNLDGIKDPETGKTGMFWYDVNRIGKYMPQFDESNLSTSNIRNQTLGGGSMVCPDHPLAGRSYAMNYWAASATKYNSGTKSFGSPGRNPTDPGEAKRGRGFDATSGGASQTILLGEAWGLFFNEGASASKPPTAWYAAADIGDLGKPGERFGGGAGITAATAFPGQWVSASAGSIEMAGLTRTTVKTYVPFYRHGATTLPFDPNGAANFARGDGSVELFRQQELLGDAGRSSMRVLWSALDREIDKVPSGEQP
ncbi:MAG TPA: hypothetical protein DEB06_06040 [Phycisphaerales bacterium]|nr:hypothetical protein [Phycisphaerales bacterium]